MKVRMQACTDYTPQSCRSALEAVVGDLSWVQPGMRIGIKANLVSAMAPETAAITHPVLLAELTRMLREKGASVVIGDSPGGLYNAAVLDRVYHVCGLKAAEAAGAELNHDFSVKEGQFPEGDELRSFSYTAWLENCDAIINFCKLKTHGMMVMTGAVKNFFGTIPGTMKPEYHFRFPDPMRFASMLVDLQLFWKPRLHIMDAVEIMEGNGPTAGKPRHMGLLLAAEDPFALDDVCAKLMGLEPKQVLTQRSAMERGLVPAYETDENWQQFRVEPELPPARSILFRSLLPGKAGEVLGRAIQRLMSTRPVLSPQKCIGCGKCAGICPADAIIMVQKKPKFRRNRCISCFCCQEFCPAGALKAERSPVARMLSGKKKEG